MANGSTLEITRTAAEARLAGDEIEQFICRYSAGAALAALLSAIVHVWTTCKLKGVGDEELHQLLARSLNRVRRGDGG